eukprot:gene57371-biopygen46970
MRAAAAFHLLHRFPHPVCTLGADDAIVENLGNSYVVNRVRILSRIHPIVLHQLTPHAHGLRDKRYDLILHLVTAADGAEEFYSLDNNEARRETPEEARSQDRRLREVWLGHPRHVVINNPSGAGMHQG